MYKILREYELGPYHQRIYEFIPGLYELHVKTPPYIGGDYTKITDPADREQIYIQCIRSRSMDPVLDEDGEEIEEEDLPVISVWIRKIGSGAREFAKYGIPFGGNGEMKDPPAWLREENNDPLIIPEEDLLPMTEEEQAEFEKKQQALFEQMKRDGTYEAAQYFWSGQAAEDFKDIVKPGVEMDHFLEKIARKTIIELDKFVRELFPGYYITDAKY